MKTKEIKFDTCMANDGHLSKSGIYKIVNKTNGSYYVGSTKCAFAKRFSRHRKQLRDKKHFNAHLQNSFNKYGEDKFVFVIVKISNKGQSLKDEQKMLDFCLDDDNCYNLCVCASAPMTGRKHTPETIAKISACSKSRAKEIGECTRKHRLGSKHSKKTIKKMSIAAKARDDSNRIAVIKSQEVRDKISKTTKGVKKPKEWRDKMNLIVKSEAYRKNMSLIKTGVKHSDAMKAKASATRLGKRITFKNDDGTIETPISLRKFSEKYNLDRHKIRALIQGSILEYNGWKIDKIVEL